jgi:hypothetical protein
MSDVTAASWNTRHFDPSAIGSAGNHACLWDIAREQLAKEGYTQVTAQQIEAKVKEIVAFHNQQEGRPEFRRIGNPDVIGDSQVIFMPADGTTLPARTTKLHVGDKVASPDGNTVLTIEWSTNEKGAAKLYVYRDDGQGFKRVGDYHLAVGAVTVEVTDDGKLLVINDGKWATYGSGNSKDARLIVQNDGNVVLYGGDGTVLWASDTQRR